MLFKVVLAGVRLGTSFWGGVPGARKLRAHIAIRKSSNWAGVTVVRADFLVVGYSNEL